MIKIIDEYLKEREITKKDFAKSINLKINTVSRALLRGDNSKRVVEELRKNDLELYKIILARKRKKNGVPRELKSKDEILKERYKKTNREQVYY